MKIARDNQIRITFHDSVVWLDLSINATYGDIARSCDAITSRRFATPVAVDITFSNPIIQWKSRAELMASA